MVLFYGRHTESETLHFLQISMLALMMGLLRNRVPTTGSHHALRHWYRTPALQKCQVSTELSTKLQIALHPISTFTTLPCIHRHVSFLFLSAAQTLILLLCAEDHTWKYWDYTGHRSLEWRTIWISVWKNMNERYRNAKRHISRIHSFVFIRLKSIIMKEVISFVKWIWHVETSVGDFSLINYSHVKEIFKN